MTAASNVSILANIQIFRGTDVTIEVGPVTDVDGSTIDWTGYTINMALTTQAGAGTQAITKSTAGGITISTTVFTIVMSDTDTAALTAKGYYWEVQATLSGTTLQVIDSRSTVTVLNSTL